MDDRVLWYASRGSGAVTLVLASAVVVLGITARMRAESAHWPRFLNNTLHREISLVLLGFLALHIVTAIVDPFTSLGITTAVVPFLSSYRTLWLGLGTVAFDLLLALLATSLLRTHIGARSWRVIHWAAYAMYPVAVAHGIGTGTDTTSPWMLVVTAASVLSVVMAILWRVSSAPADPLAAARRAAAAGLR